MTIIQTILKQIEQERARQDALFDSQPRNLKPTFYLTLLTEELGEVARAILDGNSINYRQELIQVAAVAIAAIEEFDSGFACDDLETVCDRLVYQRELDERDRALENLVDVCRQNTPTEPPQQSSLSE